MSIVPARHAFVALFVVCTCATVAACGQAQTGDANASPTQSASASGKDASQAYQPNQLQRNELQDWARQATSTESPHTASAAPKDALDAASQAAVARTASDALATPVIHTVD